MCRLNALANTYLVPRVSEPVVIADILAECRTCALCKEPIFDGDPLCPSLLAHEACSQAEFNEYLENPGKYEDGCFEDYARDFPAVSRWTDAELAASETSEHGAERAF